MNRRGMTLIEVLLSVAILATLSALAARAISQAIRAKTKIQEQIDDVSRVRDAIRLIERDINLAYHHLDIEKELDDLVKKKPAPAVPPGAPPPTTTAAPEPPREAPRKDPTTHFIGSEEDVSFVTMNNARMVRDSRQADFLEVGYAVRDCSSTSGQGSSKCLWRRSSPYVDDDVTKGGVEVVLLENVTEFELKYIGKGKQDWVTTWRTDQSGDATTKNNFPQAVQVSLTVEKESAPGKTKKFSWQIVASVHFPNNKETSGARTGTTAAPQ